MNRSDLTELHFIAPIATVPSILQRGILCHRLAKDLPHESIAMPEIQDIRARKTVPEGRKLHDYANLYLCARNPMLFKLKEQHKERCVLRVSPAVLDLSGVVIADANAARAHTGFWASPQGLAKIDAGRLFAEYWTDPNPIEARRNKGAKCAEVLVPERVPPSLLLGAYVSCPASQERLAAACPRLPVSVDAHLFFVD